MSQADRRGRTASDFGSDATLGTGLPAHWTLEDFQKRVRTILDGYLSALVNKEETVACFQEFATEASGFFDEVVVLTLRTALERSPQHREMLSGMLARLHSKGLLTSPVLVRGYAKLLCTWQDLVVDDGAQAPVVLVGLLLDSIQSGCIDEGFLTRLPEGLLDAVIRDGPDGEMQAKLQQVKDRLHDFKRLLLEEPAVVEAPSQQEADLEDWTSSCARHLRSLAMPECHHEFVKRSLVSSLTWAPADRALSLALLDKLHSEGIITKDDLQWGTIWLLGQLEDLTLDCPDAHKIVAEHLQGLVAKDLVPTVFLQRCQLLRVGGGPGISVLKDALEPSAA